MQGNHYRHWQLWQDLTNPGYPGRGIPVLYWAAHGLIMNVSIANGLKVSNANGLKSSDCIVIHNVDVILPRILATLIGLDWIE